MGTRASVFGSRSKKISTAGLPVANRGPQVSVQGADEEAAELLVDRPVEAERLEEMLAVVARGVLREEEVGRVSRDPRQREDDEREDDEDHQALQDAPEDEALQLSDLPHGQGRSSGRGMRSATSPNS